jgi:flagella synthesis protein FlgN
LSDAQASIAAEVTGFRNLITLLESEQEALRSADTDALADVVPAKLAQVNALQEMGAARTRILRSAGLSPNAQGMRRMLSNCPNPDRVREQWEELTELAADALRRNELNIRLANVQQQYVDRAVAALYAAAGQDTTYGADGRPHHQAATRALASI